MESLALVIILNLLIGPLFLVIGLIFKLYPPKKINDLYGYRTKRSKKNQSNWDFANALSSQMMIYVGVITTLVQGLLYLMFSASTTIMVASCILVAGLIITIPYTEQKLKQFENDQLE